MDELALKLWIDRLDQSIDQSPDSGVYSALRSETNKLKESLAGLTTSFGSTGPVVSSGSTAPGSSGLTGAGSSGLTGAGSSGLTGAGSSGSTAPGSSGSTGTGSGGDADGSQSTTAISQASVIPTTGPSATAPTNTATTRTLSDRPRGIPYQPESSATMFGLTSMFIILFF
jgi:hypothetical protein